MNLVFATNNPHKLREIRHLLGGGFTLLSLDDIGCSVDIPETQSTLQGNASEKAFFVYDNYNINCFADDTGLEIDALSGAPGVLSARYAGEDKSFEKNMQKVLVELSGTTNRNARFRTVISLIINGKEELFEGIVNGTILNKKKGEEGFGYDPIFQPEGYDMSFAQMTLEKKNSISHRGIAFRKLVEFLSKIY